MTIWIGMPAPPCPRARSVALATLLLSIYPSLAAVIADEPRLICRDSYLPGVPVLLRVELLADGAAALDRSRWDAMARLSTNRAEIVLTPSEIHLYNGVGSALVSIAVDAAVTEPLDFELTARVGDRTASTTLRSARDDPVTLVETDVLPAGITEWSGVVHLRGSLTVPREGTLVLQEGTLVVIDGVATDEGQPGSCNGSPADDPASCGPVIRVAGALESLGTAARPVTITASDPARAWGEIHHDAASESTYRYTHITRGGNSDRGGHTNTGPTLRATDSRVVFDHCAITDSAGKIAQARGSDLVFTRCLLARAIMGPEIDGTALVFSGGHILQMFGSDDNDGIYLHSQRSGQEITILDTVVAAGDDDGIDTLNAEVLVERCLVRDYADKGVSIFSDTVTVRRCLIADNDIGVSAKETGAAPRIEHTTIVGNRLGVEARDKNGKPDLFIDFQVRDSIILGNDPVRTDYPTEHMQIRYSLVGESWPGEGNIFAAPLFVDAAAHDFHLQPGSPCIDAGDPDSPTDADGTRADIGAFPFTRDEPPPPGRFTRGEANGDRALDVGDPLAVLLHLFGPASLLCQDAGDSDDDGRLEIDDAVVLLERLFLRGAPLPFPSGTDCAEDPTPDDLPCEQSTCD